MFNQKSLSDEVIEKLGDVYVYARSKAMTQQEFIGIMEAFKFSTFIIHTQPSCVGANLKEKTNA